MPPKIRELAMNQFKLFFISSSEQSLSLTLFNVISFNGFS